MTTPVYVYTMSRLAGGGSWSWYEFPVDLEDWALHQEDLYVRSGDTVYRVVDDEVRDEVAPSVFVAAEGVVQWPWLDMGSPGQNKELGGFDIVASGNPQVAVGFDQSSKGTFTDPVLVPSDTPPDMIIPMTVTAPSFSMKITFDGTLAWELLALNIYLVDRRLTS